MKYPVCPQKEFKETYFDVQVEDPYHWLRDAKDPEAVRWVKEENALTDEWFEKTELEKKIASLKVEKIVSPFTDITPWKDGYIGTRMSDGEFTLWKLDAGLREEKLLMDGKSLKGYSPFLFSGSPVKENYAAVMGMYDGDTLATPLIIDCEKKKIVKTLQNTFYFKWSGEKPVIYYPEICLNGETKESEVFFKAYNVETQEEKCILRTPGIIGDIKVSSDGKVFVLEAYKDYTVSWFYLYQEEKEQITDITVGQAVEMKYADSFGGSHYFVSKEISARGELLSVENKKGIREARTVVPEGSATLDTAFVIGNSFYILETENASYRLMKLHGGRKERVELPGEIYTLTYAGREKDRVFLRYESFTETPMLLGIRENGWEMIYRSREEDYPDIVVEQKKAPSKADQKEIPYFIVRRKDLDLNGENPTCMYAYGGYNCAMYPWSQDMVTGLDIAGWVQKGGIYVLANIRGGSEFGASWHEEGMLMKKKNCYYDFIGITEQLIKEKWTNSSKIAIDGCSNGGLLMSALVTMRPDLFGCVIDSVPHTDMLQFAEDDRGPMYITEYGDPRESKESFSYFMSYSPYHNVKRTDYPACYIQTGECDNNVPPYHGKKFAAKLQEMNTSDNPVLLRVLEKGAHNRGTGEVYWQTIAEMQLFVEKHLLNGKEN